MKLSILFANIVLSRILHCKMERLILFSMLSLYVLMKTANCNENTDNSYTKGINNSHSALLNHFGSLLGSGRTLSFPFAPGLILSLINENIWNVSTNGFEDIFKVPASSMGKAYIHILDTLKKDSKSSLQNFIYQNNKSAATMKLQSQVWKERWEQFSTQYQEISWDNSSYWEELDDKVSNGTDGKLRGELFPKAFGRIFDDKTEAAILNTFHYRNSWKYDWKHIGNSVFGDSEEMGNFLETDGEFLVSEEDEYTAVAVPLTDEKKSVVFVLPTYNLTKHFRGDDEVPLPHIWVKRNWKIKVPEINFTKLDQYGKELQQLGINETFCTTIHDKIGKFPFYLRPIAQANYVNLNAEFLEIASATGTAVQEFALGADINGNGYPLQKNENYPPNKTITDTTLKMLKKIEEDIQGVESVNSDNDTVSGAVSKEISFDRPFLWYINDIDVGPIFFGFVNSIVDSMDMNSSDIWKKEISMVYLWSCKSFSKTVQKPPI